MRTHISTTSPYMSALGSTACGLDTFRTYSVVGTVEVTDNGERVEPGTYGITTRTCAACVEAVSTYSVSRDADGATALWRSTDWDIWGPTALLYKDDADPGVWQAACRSLVSK